MGLLEATLSGLGTAGEYADKYTGSRAIRGVLGNKPREALSFLPGSDALGITDPRQATSGRDLTDKFGLTRQGDDSYLAHGLGMGAEMVLDPFTLGAGALSGVLAARKLHGAAGAGHAGGDMLDAIRGFAHDESGAAALPHLGLKYDVTPPSLYPGQVWPPVHTPISAHLYGLDRADPEWVNNRTFFHGTATPGLGPAALDPRKTAPDGLFGRGIYTTDEGGRAGLETTRGYADAAVRNKIDMNAMRPHLDALHREWVAQHGAGNAAYPTLDDLFAAHPELRSQTIYRAHSDFGKILDLNAPMKRRQFKSVLDSLMPLAEHADEAGAVPYGHQNWADAFRFAGPAPHEKTATVERLLSKARDANQAALLVTGHGKDPLIAALKGAGYDAITHTGGRRVGQFGDHQVVIGLDPNDVLKQGRSTPYKVWEALKDFGANESGAAKIPLNRIDADQKSLLQNIGRLLGRGTKPNETHAALNVGPAYAGGSEKLMEILMGADPNAGAIGKMSDVLRDTGAMERLAGEIPEGSKYLGSGVEGTAFGTPMGHVVRFNRDPGNPIARLDDPAIMPAFRSAFSGGRTFEHTPKAIPLDHIDPGERLWTALDNALYHGDPSNPAHVATMLDLHQRLRQFHPVLDDAQEAAHAALTQRGIDPWDWHNGNVALTPEGRVAIIDPGAAQLQGAQDRSATMALADKAMGLPVRRAPFGGWTLGQNTNPERYRFPVPDNKLSADPAFLARVRQAGIPSLVRDSIEAQARRGSQGIGHPSPALEDMAHAGSIDRLGELGRLFGGHGFTEPGSPETFEELVRLLGMSNQGIPANQAIARLSDSGVAAPNLYRWLDGHYNGRPTVGLAGLNDTSGRFNPGTATDILPMLAMLLGGGVMAGANRE